MTVSQTSANISGVGTKGSTDKHGYLDLARPSGTSVINTYNLNFVISQGQGPILYLT